MSTPPDKGPISAEIKKRRTQEIQRQIDERARGNDPRRTSQTIAAVPTPPEAKRATGTMAANVPVAPTSAELKRVTGSTAAIRPQPDPRATQQAQTVAVPAPRRLTRGQERMILAGLFVLLLACVSTAAVLLSSNTFNKNTTNIPTFVPLPLSTAKDVVIRLQSVGMNLSNIHELVAASEGWQASQEIQFDASEGTDKGTFLVMSYPSQSARVPDTFRAASDKKYKDWQLMGATNVLLLISPQTSQALRDKVVSHFNQYLIAPYRSFLPTSTPVK